MPSYRAGLSRSELRSDPLQLFDEWYAEAQRCNLPEPTAVTLATASSSGTPAARTVLLKHHDARGFVFVTQYTSRKGRELEANPQACLLFYWPPLARQVRVSGSVAVLPAAESDALFANRSRESQLGAWASQQSEPIANRQALIQRLEQMQQRFAEVVPRPPRWGGYRVTPHEIEFWWHREHRLHDRFVFTQTSGGGWDCTRLAP